MTDCPPSTENEPAGLRRQAEAAVRQTQAGAKPRAELEKRQAAEAKFAALQASTLCFGIAALDGRYVEVNEAYARLIGYTCEEIVGKTAAELGVLTEAEQLAVRDRLTAAGGFASNMTLNVRHRDGTLRQVLYSVQPVTLEGQVYHLGVAQDMTELTRVEQALHESEERYRTIVEMAGEGIIMAKPDGSYFYVNQRMAEMLGYLAEALLGKSTHDLVFDDERPQVVQALQTLHRGQVVRGELKFRRQDGSALWSLYHATPLFNAQGEHLANFAMHTDITERKQAEAALQMATERLALTQQAAGAGGWDWDMVTGQINWTPLMFELLGLDPQTASASFEAWRTVMHPDDRLQAGRRLEQAFKADGHLVNEYRVIRANDGQTRWISALGQAFFDEQGAPVRISGICLDITARKQAEDEIRQLNANLETRVAARTAELQQANQALAAALRTKSEFLSIMSHELRTPLTAVLGLAQALALNTYGPLTADQRRVLAMMEASGNHLLDLIADILDYVQIEADKLTLAPQAVSIAAVCEASLQRVRPLARQKRQRLNLVTDLSTATLHADEARLQQILANLLSNAVKFTPEGGQVTLEVHGVPARRVIHFTVSDTGIGIALQHQQPLLFDPFFQIDSCLARQFEGTGLGLALVRRLVDLHGGSLSLESELGRGSRFRVSLPWQPAGEAQLPDAGRLPPGFNVLLADDSPASLTALADHLRAAGATLLIAHSGLEAVEQARQGKPDFILLDVEMPVMDGLEAIRHIRQQEGGERLPIVVLTALALAGDRERCLAAGANDYVVKPVGAAELLEILKRWQPAAPAALH